MYRPTTLMEYLDATYIPARLELTEGSAEQLRVAVRRFSAWLGREATLADLDAPLLVSWLRAQRETLSPSTVNSRRGSILALWNDAADAGLVEPPPRRGVPKVREPLPVPEAFTLEEMARLVAACRCAPGRWSPGVPAGFCWEILVSLIWDTAVRIGSVLGARVDDVDRRRGTWLVPARHVKGRRADRLFRLHPDTVGLIAESVDDWPARERLFPFPFGRRQLWPHFSKILDDAGLPSTRRHKFHCLRRSSESHAAAVLGVAATAEIVGHSEAVARKHYIAPSIVGTQSLVDVLPRF